jgi:hypothetical protein
LENERPSVTFIIGILLTAALIGFMCGASNSPIVGAVVPLLFGLLSVAATQFSSPSAIITNVSPRAFGRATGLQLVVFACGFGAGTWTGIAARVGVVQFWLATPRPAVTAVQTRDMIVFSAALELDERMTRDKVPLNDRLSILRELTTPIKPPAMPDDSDDVDDGTAAVRRNAQVLLTHYERERSAATAGEPLVPGTSVKP